MKKIVFNNPDVFQEGGPTCKSIADQLGMDGTPKTGDIRQMVCKSDGTIEVHLADSVNVTKSLEEAIKMAFGKGS